MRIAVFGTGSVGQTLAAKLNSLGHEVVIGTRNVKETLARTEKDRYGNPGFPEWFKSQSGITVNTFGAAAAGADLIINATQGAVSIDIFKSVNPENLADKIVLDIANPLDFSKGMPPGLIPGLSNFNSLGEEMQKSFPQAKVVKTLNTMWCGLMVNPGMAGNGDHINFICGNDQDAKDRVISLLKDFGWKEENCIDLGDITASRGTEGVLPLWLRVMMTRQTAAFNFNLVG
jgi:predicted dinucleotide-binding enzyme